VVSAGQKARLVVVKVLVGLIRVVDPVTLLPSGRAEVGFSGKSLVNSELILGG